MSNHENTTARPVLDFTVAPEDFMTDEAMHEQMTDWEVTQGQVKYFATTHIDSAPDEPPF